jgi:hypothetical protein
MGPVSLVPGKTVEAQLQFWRAAAIALLTFILGNGTSYLVFGLHAASRHDLELVNTAADGRSARLEDRMVHVEQGLNFLAGELHAKGD